MAGASLCALSAQSASPMVDIKGSMEVIDRKRSSLFSSLFPYAEKEDRPQSHQSDRTDYDALFAELDEIIAKEEASDSGSDSSDSGRE